MTDAAANGADTQPQIGLLAQYVKDLSFENPNSPAVYSWQTQPQIDIQFNISSTPAAEDVHEVSIRITAKAASEDEARRVCLDYAKHFYDILGDCVYAMDADSLEEVAVKARSNGKGPRHVIWFATRR